MKQARMWFSEAPELPVGREIIIDGFAGGGGASLGIERALGRSPDLAVNHDYVALQTHEENHPQTTHCVESVWRVNLQEKLAGRQVGLLWASPDCRHFSRAKGAKPVSKSVRALAWVVCRWAEEFSPRVIILENVREFAEWGPIVPAWRCGDCHWRGTEGQAMLDRKRPRCARCDSKKVVITEDMIPDPKRKGITFRRFVNRLKRAGYVVEWRTLNAADFGAPTHRRRLFLVARRDGRTICWPEPTHGPDRPHAWIPAAACIDWSLPCPSIFTREKDLAEKTLRRIALGLMRYVIENANPFIVPVNHGGDHFRGQPLSKPLSTVTGKRGHALVTPFLSRYNGQNGNESRCQSPLDPLTTIDTQPRFALVAPSIVQVNHTGSTGRSSYAWDAQEPLRTVTSAPGFGVVAASLTQFHGNSVGQSLDEPAPTQLKCGHTSLVAAMVTKFYGGVVGHDVERPLGTVTAVDHHGLVGAYLTRFNHGDKQWNGVDEPLGTVTSQGNKFGLVYAFLVKFFGSGGQWQTPAEPLHTVTSKSRFAVVQVEVAPGKHEPAVAIDVPGVGPCIIADIGLRMLVPRELARAQGFPDSYKFLGSQAKQVAMIGNSVSPMPAEALIRANYEEVAHAS